jgi:tetratricopeptide (TPR) repeat protein
MNFNKLHIFIVIGIGLISGYSYAQKPFSEEKSDLNFQTHFFEALKEKAVDNYTKAIESLEKCYEIDSTNLAVAFEFSKNYLLLKKYFEAEIFINKAIEKEPENIHLLSHKVSILKSQRNYNDAIVIQKKIIEKKPTYSDQLVLLYMQNRDFESAEKLIATIEGNALSTSRIRRFKTYLATRKSTVKKKNNIPKKETKNKGIEFLKNLYKEKKEYKALLEILKYEVKNNLFELLNIDCKNALELFPAQPFLYKLNGFALNKLGKYTEAIDVLTIGIDFVIDNVEMEVGFYNQLIIGYEGLNNKKEALKYKQKAEKLKQVN